MEMGGCRVTLATEKELQWKHTLNILLTLNFNFVLRISHVSFIQMHASAA